MRGAFVGGLLVASLGCGALPTPIAVGTPHAARASRPAPEEKQDAIDVVGLEDVPAVAAVATKPNPHGAGPPITTDVSIAIDAMPAPAAPSCTIHGTGRPFTNGCHTADLPIAADDAGKIPVAMVDDADVDVRFGFSPGEKNVWATISARGLEVSGYSPVADLAFRLRFDAPAFGGHIVLKADSEVHVAGVGAHDVFVKTSDDLVDISDVVATSPCTGLGFDPYQADASSSTDAPDRVDALATGPNLHLQGLPGGPTFFTLQPLGGAQLGLSLRVLERVKDARRVTFTTDHARFDAWVNASEINEEPFGGIGIGGTGSGLCGGSTDAFAAPTYVVRRDLDVLVGATPAMHGPRGVKLAKGAVVGIDSIVDGWAEIYVPGAPIGPPKDMFFFVPFAALE